MVSHEILQTSYGSVILRTDVDFRHLVALHSASVLHIDCECEILTGLNFLGTRSGVAVSERGIAQSIAKTVEWAASEKAVRAPRHIVVIKGGQVLRMAVDGDGKSSRRIVFSEDHVGNGVSTLFTGIPG